MSLACNKCDLGLQCRRSERDWQAILPAQAYSFLPIEDQKPMTVFNKTLAGTALCSVLALAATPAFSQERVQIEWWYALSGRLGDLTQEMIANFNASQDQYEVVGIHKGNYEETMAAMVAAYRVGQQPTLLM